ncbi:MAG TPA: DUF2231 domain-containing protein [Actinomycetes bacterium]|nr:DUF2231 domain-containing protein [Actinomycetes bacterium]
MIPESVLGLPIHPLVVHAVIVLVPLAALLTIVVAVSPDRRARLGWLTWFLATAALGSALVARFSGLNLEQALYPEVLPPLVSQHKALGVNNIWFVIALWLAVTALLLLDYDRRRRTGISSPVLPTVVAVVAILAAMAATSQVLLTAWSGTQAHWTGIVHSDGNTHA